jgi:hypothetical protein
MPPPPPPLVKQSAAGLSVAATRVLGAGELYYCPHFSVHEFLVKQGSYLGYIKTSLGECK